MIGSLDVMALDCPEPRVLAAFYGEVLGMEIVPGGDDDWVEIAPPGGESVLAFQQVEGFRPPEWPGQEVPQQAHLDIRVQDLDTGEAAVLALGATASGSGEKTFRVYLDPVGHPFCLVSANG